MTYKKKPYTHSNEYDFSRIKKFFNWNVVMDKESTFKITKLKELGIPVGYYPLLYFNDLANRQNAFFKRTHMRR